MNEENERLEKRKKILMLNCKKILSMSRRAVSVIRGQTMCNLKLIERTSKCVKDPNPLSSTMSTISMKYPISIRKDKAIQFKIPTKFLALRDGEAVPDTHQHARILCKKEAVDWWVEQNIQPEEKVLPVIDLLYDLPRREVAAYYSVTWSEAKVNFGKPSLERQIVSTREPKILMETKHRVPAIKQLLCPDYTIPYENIPETELQSLKHFLGHGLETNISLQRQIRLLLTNMDPRRRVLPLVPGTIERVASFKHAILGAAYSLRNIVVDTGGSRDLQLLTQEFGRCLIQAAKRKKAPLSTVIDAAASTKIMGTPVKDLIKRQDITENNEIRWMKALFGLPIMIESCRDGLTTSPLPSTIHIMRLRNKKGVGFTLYKGQETVRFKYEEIRGTFEHNGELLLNISCNLTSVDSLVRALAEIAIYCRYNFSHTHSKNVSQMRNDIRRIVRAAPDMLIRAAKGDMEKLYALTEYPHRIGILTINEFTEYSASKCKDAYISQSNYNISLGLYKQTLDYEEERVPPAVTFEDNINCVHQLLLDHFSFPRLIKNRVLFYMQNWKTLRGEILNGNFTWENQPVSRFLGPSGRGFSYLVRVVLSQLARDEDWDSGYSAVMYCFAFPVPTREGSMNPMTTKSGHLVDIHAREGVLTFHEGEKKYCLFNDYLTNKVTELDISTKLTGLIPGFRFLAKVDPDLPTYSVNRLVKERDTMRACEQVNVMVHGMLFTAQKDPLITYQTERTLLRQIEEKKSVDLVDAALGFAKKRKGYMGMVNEPSSSKRPKVADEPGPSTLQDPVDLFPSDSEEEINMDEF